MPVEGIRSLSEDGTKLDCQYNPSILGEKTSYLLTSEKHDVLEEFVRIDFL